MIPHVPPTLYSVDLAACGELGKLQPEDVKLAFGAALRRAGATIVESISHDFPGIGLTCVCILSESHAILHTWPETGTVNLDIFSCSPRLKSLEAIDELRLAFGAQQVTIQEIPRADGHRQESSDGVGIIDPAHRGPDARTPRP
jgi:S-adenosylmethionine decarboxylase proenzyme